MAIPTTVKSFINDMKDFIKEYGVEISPQGNDQFPEDSTLTFRSKAIGVTVDVMAHQSYNEWENEVVFLQAYQRVMRKHKTKLESECYGDISVEMGDDITFTVNCKFDYEEGSFDQSEPEEPEVDCEFNRSREILYRQQARVQTHEGWSTNGNNSQRITNNEWQQVDEWRTNGNCGSMSNSGWI